MRASTCGCSTSRSSAGAPSTPSSIRSAASSVPRDAPLGTVLRWVVDRGLRWASGAIGRAERHHPGARCRRTRTPAWRCTSLGRSRTSCDGRSRRRCPTRRSCLATPTSRSSAPAASPATPGRSPSSTRAVGSSITPRRSRSRKERRVVDDEANVVSLQLYRQRSDGAADPPAVVPADAHSIAFAEQVRSGIDAPEIRGAGSPPTWWRPSPIGAASCSSARLPSADGSVAGTKRASGLEHPESGTPVL